MAETAWTIAHADLKIKIVSSMVLRLEQALSRSGNSESLYKELVAKLVLMKAKTKTRPLLIGPRRSSPWSGLLSSHMKVFGLLIVNWAISQGYIANEIEVYPSTVWSSSPPRGHHFVYIPLASMMS